MKLTSEENLPTNVLKILNDNCLTLILKHLSLRDLCAAAEVFACSDGEILFDGDDSMALLQSLLEPEITLFGWNTFEKAANLTNLTNIGKIWLNWCDIYIKNRRMSSTHLSAWSA